MPQMSLERFVRVWNASDFTITGDQVRIGERTWQARPCPCGLSGCSGWAMIPRATGARTKPARS